MKIVKRILLLLLIFPLALVAQEEEFGPIGNDNRSGNANDRLITNKEVNVEGEKPPITDYLIISQKRDTTYLDTTLSLQKDYKFNVMQLVVC